MFQPKRPRPKLVVDRDFTKNLIDRTQEPATCERPWNIPAAFMPKPQYRPNLRDNHKTLIAALSPSSASKDDIDLLLRSQIYTFVILMKYGNVEQIKALLDAMQQSIAEFEDTELGRYVPVVVGAELRTNKIRIGRLEDEKLQLCTSDAFALTWDRNFSGSGSFCDRIFVNLSTMYDRLNIGDFLKVGEEVELEIQEIVTDQSTIRCLVVNGGKLFSHSLVQLPVVINAAKETMQDFAFAQQHNLDFVVLVDLDREPAEVVQKICKQDRKLQIFGHLSSDVITPMIQSYFVKYFDGFWGNLSETEGWLLRSGVQHLPVCGQILDTKSEITANSRHDSVILEWPQGFDITKESLIPDNVQKFMQKGPKEPEVAIPDDNVMFGMMLSLKQLSFTLQTSAIILLSRTGRSAKTLSRLNPPCKVVVVTTNRRVAAALRFFRNLEALWWPNKSESNEHTIKIAVDYYKHTYPSPIDSTNTPKFLCCHTTKKNGKFPNVIRAIEERNEIFLN